MVCAVGGNCLIQFLLLRYSLTTCCSPLLANSNMSLTWLSSSLSLSCSLWANWLRRIPAADSCGSDWPHTALPPIKAYEFDGPVRQPFCPVRTSVADDSERACNWRVSVRSVSTISCPGSFTSGVIDSFHPAPIEQRHFVTIVSAGFKRAG